MNAWLKGAILGFLLALFVAGWAARATTFEAFLRVGSDRAVLDLRLDESTVGRVTNIPTAVLGETSLTKRSWLILTTYEFALRLRPDAAPEISRAVRGLEVTTNLPGRVVATNATRVADGTAVWETLPVGALQFKTRAIHWGRIVVLGALAAAITALGRRQH